MRSSEPRIDEWPIGYPRVVVTWTEKRSPGSHSIPNGDYRAIVLQTGGPSDPVEITYRRFKAGNPSPLGWRPDPTNTAIAVVPDAGWSPNLGEGKQLARGTLAKLSSGEIIATEHDYEPPTTPETVAEISHPTKWIVAIVLKWPEFYEVRTIGYVPNGFTLPVATPTLSQDPDYEWGRLDLSERLLSDTEEEARKAAEEELERLASLDIPIRLRDAAGA